jgi:antitoxin MazE
MKVSITKTGNTRGIRLSKLLLKKYNIRNKIELIPEKGQIIIRPVTESGKGYLCGLITTG